MICDNALLWVKGFGNGLNEKSADRQFSNLNHP